MTKINPLDVLMDKLNSQHDDDIPFTGEKVTIRLTGEHRQMFAKVANERNLTVTSYMRLAVLSFLAHHTGTPLSEIVAEYEKIDRAPRTANKASATGEGTGPWQIQALKP